MTKQKEKKKRLRIYLIRSLGIVIVFSFYFFLAHVLLNYLVILFTWIADSVSGFAATVAQTDASVSLTTNLSDVFFFRLRYLVETPAVIPFWMPIAGAVFFAVLSGWKIVRKVERLISKFNVDYYYKEIEGSSRWATQKEMEQYLTPVEKGKLDQAEQTGIILAEDSTNYYMDTTNSNTLIVGTTRSGKGQLLVLNSIRAMASGLNKISMVVIDPKGENIRDTYAALKKEGYRILVLNYRDPSKSLQNNPLWPIIREYIKYQKQTKNLSDKLLADPNYQPLDNEEADLSKVEDLTSDLTYLITVNPKSDPIWPESASELLKAIIYYLLDVGHQNNTIDELTMYTVYVFFAEKGSVNAPGVPGDPNATQLDLLFQKLPRDNPARLAYATSKFASGEMKSSIFATLASNLRIFRDAGIVKMTSGNAVDFALLADEKTPTAIFLIIPDEKPSRHVLASISVKQCYSELVDLADANGGELQRRVAFVYDEFGNMPPIKDMGTVVSVTLSRNILWNLYIQNFAQLNDKYGQEVANTIRANVANLVYILASDLNTNKEISEIMGAGTKEFASFTGEHGSILEAETTTTHLKGRSLQTPDELFRTGLWELFIIRTRCFPMHTKITPYFELEIPQTRLEEILKDNPAKRQRESRIMQYDSVLKPQPEKSNCVLPYFAANIRTFETETIPQDQMKAETPDFEFFLTSKICKLTKNAFAKALDSSNFSLARKLVQDKKDLSEVTETDAERLVSMIARYETEEIIPLTEE